MPPDKRTAAVYEDRQAVLAAGDAAAVAAAIQVIEQH